MFSDEEIMSGNFAGIILHDGFEMVCTINVGMAAKYSRQASLRVAGSTSNVTVTTSISTQFSHQQSVQVLEKSDDEKVCCSMLSVCMPSDNHLACTKDAHCMVLCVTVDCSCAL